MNPVEKAIVVSHIPIQDLKDGDLLVVRSDPPMRLDSREIIQNWLKSHGKNTAIFWGDTKLSVEQVVQCANVVAGVKAVPTRHTPPAGHIAVYCPYCGHQNNIADNARDYACEQCGTANANPY